MKKQSGFTLIELVIVIVILGILAATALPRFVNLAGDARVAKVNAALGAVKSGANILHATHLARATAHDDTVEGVTMEYGYPTADAAGIGTAAGVTADYVGNADGTDWDIEVTGGSDQDACKAVYTPPTTVGGSPSYSTTTTGCF